MAKYKIKVQKPEETIPEIIPETEFVEPEVQSIPEPVVQEIFSNEPTLTINQFLASNSPNRKIDNVFTRWCFLQDGSNPAKTLQEWNQLFQNFLNEK